MRRSTVLAALLVALAVIVTTPAAGAPAQTPKRGGTVVVGVPAGAEPACFNPTIAACYLPSTFGIFGIREDLIFARPFSNRPDFTFRPDLVARVTLTKRPFSITFHIRPEARWSDGRPVTARDLDFYYRSAVASEFFQNCCPDEWFWSVARTRVLDARTYRMWVRRPVAGALVKGSFRSGVVPRHVYQGVDRSGPAYQEIVIGNPRTGEPIGSGPYLMQGRQRGRQITLVRNRRYWGPHTAHLDRLVFRFLPPAELADALRRGEIDLILPGVTGTDDATQELRRTRPPGVSVVSAPSAQWETFVIRVRPGGHAALESKLVRRALVYGIDRAALARRLEQRVFGRTTPRLAPLESVVHLSQDRYYEPNWKRYRHDQAEARRLLARAGCRPGADGIRVCGGERLSLRVGTSAGVVRRQLTLSFVQAQLRQIGVEVLPQYLPNTRVVTRAFADGSLDLALWALSYGSGAGTFTPGGLFRCGGGDNATGHCSRLVTRELDNADRVLDDESRARALNRADRLLAGDVPVIPLYQVPAYVALRTDLRIPDLDPNDPLWNAEDWWRDR